MAILKVKVIPGAGKNEIAGIWMDMLKIKVTAQPESGKANKACIELLSEVLGVSKNKIEILRGEKSREKQLKIECMNEEDLKNKIDSIVKT